MSEVKFDFAGKNFIVTGASSGIGRQISVELAAAGANVLAVARRLPQLQTLQSEYPNNIEISSVDVCDKDALSFAIKSFVEKHGKLNGSIHAAGITAITPIKAFDIGVAETIMRVSFWAGMDLINIANKAKYSEQGSSHVLFSSIWASAAGKGMFAYAGAKGAIRSAIRAIAKEIALKNSRINVVSPGWVKSEMTDDIEDITNTEDIRLRHLLGVGTPNDVSGVVLFLLSDRAKWITATDVVVDGGYLS